MITSAPQLGAKSQHEWQIQTLVQVFVLILLLALLANYKWVAGLKRIKEIRAAGSIHLAVSPNGVPLADSASGSALRYLRIVWPALLFGVLISAAVRTSFARTPIGSLFGHGRIRDQFAGAITGVPLMLCSCCSAPIFASLYERSRKAGPSLAVTLASPSLNPAALTLSFFLFPLRIVWARIAMALVLIFVGAIFAGRLAQYRPQKNWITDSDESGTAGWPELSSAYVKSLVHVSLGTVPLILVGIFASMWIMRRFPAHLVTAGGMHSSVILVVAFFAVLLALPSFFEIPLALSILIAGGPAGAAAALLFAGPAINLPSLLVIGRCGGWKLAVSLALIVWCIAVFGALLLR